MRCVTIDNGHLSLLDRDTPLPPAGDVVVEVAAAGINAADLLQRAGFYPAPPGWPADVPGLELAGRVTAVGDGVSDSLLGRRVCAVVGGGGQATHCVVPSTHLVPVPDTISWADAGGFAEAFTTAHDALITQAQLRAGEHVVISGAAGGVGSAAVQIAALRGARVTAVVRTLAHDAELRALGAHDVIVTDQVTNVDAVDVVLELVGAAHLELVQGRLAPGGRVVVIGVGAGSRATIDLLGLMQRRALVTGSTLRARSREEKSHVAAAVSRDLATGWADGRIRVPAVTTFDLDNVEAAYDYFSTPGKFGKVVLVTSAASHP